jgi:hypothetical protein
MGDAGKKSQEGACKSADAAVYVLEEVPYVLVD